ncbi:protein unc-79 homolog [Salvelinus sp. IW2-2015]|uniref:protein unc-79 homolog n=1 Tax=Salvelinus sp. IW2-2015 TaxID=2691554 RepID=UPI0038D3EA62
MSTKAEQFASKIRYLQEYHNRVQHNIYPVPSGTDIANTLKYFSQTLLSVLRDAPPDRGGQGQQSRDAQLSEYPSLDYQGLYATLVTLLDLVPLLQHGQHDLGQSIFYTTTCLLPFLSDDILSTLPYTMISTLATFPPFLHKDIIEYLSTSFLPMAVLGSTRREGGVPAYVNLSASSMLMIAMQYTSNPVYHCQLLECLMKHKQEVWKDLLYVISYGPSQVKPPAVQMLFHYWPNLKPPGAISEYRGLQYTAWNPIHCQHIECHNAINKPAVKAETEAMETYVSESLVQGYIRPSTSSASSSFFFVKKKDGGLRPCVDYRGINQITVGYSYPLPLIASAIESMHGARFFTKLDLRSAYNLVCIQEGDEWKTAFSTTSVWELDADIEQALRTEPAPLQCPARRLYVPSAVRDRLIYWAHTSPSSGHPGIGRTVRCLSGKYCWPTLVKDVRVYVSSCLVCAQCKAPRHLPRVHVEGLEGIHGPSGGLGQPYLRFSPRE